MRTTDDLYGLTYRNTFFFNVGARSNFLSVIAITVIHINADDDDVYG